MRRLAMLGLLAACGGSGGSPHGAVVLRDEFCAYVVHDLGNFLAVVPAYVRLQYADSVVVVEDEWGLVREGAENSIAWNMAWQNGGGVLGECESERTDTGALRARIADGTVVSILDYSTGFFVEVTDLGDFLATHE